MAEEFEASVEDGLRFAKRIYFGKDRAVVPPKPPTAMERAAGYSYLPNSPMLYAVIIDPAIVDNPDMPSYQPHVHGRCNPAALIPLQMNGVSLEVNCYLDTAFVTVNGTWRVHCVKGNRSCDCRIAVPMGEQGSILGVEVELPRKSFHTEFIVMDNEKIMENVAKSKGGCFLKADIFTLTVPQIEGGTNISVKLRWSQKLLYHDGQFTLDIPFDFPEYVTPAAKKISKREKIELNVNACPETEVLCQTTSHPLKERVRQTGKLGFLYDAEVLLWSSSDFVFTYTVSSSHTFGSLLLSPPILGDVDRRDMFCCYVFPVKQQSCKVFRKELVFVVDISGSMKGKPLQDTKNALFSALAKLDPEDMFNVIAFNGETFLFSYALEPATAEAIENVNKWINTNFLAGGDTNILLPLNQAIKMLSESSNSIPIIFLITDGAVEDERSICDIMRNEIANHKNIRPRIYTLGIGTFCNQYFLRMLAMISQGHHVAAIDVDSVEDRIGELFARASSIFIADIAFQNLDELDDFEVFPSQIPDLSSESPLIVSGRYCGTFPDTVKVNGTLSDMSSFLLELKVEEAKETPVDKMVSKRQIELLTSQAWYSENLELMEKIVNMSVQIGIASEYTNMALIETQKLKPKTDSTTAQKTYSKVDHHKEEPKPQKSLKVHHMTLGFGNLNATSQNIPSGHGDPKSPDSAEVFARAASDWCRWLCNHCCCMCCVQVCSKMNDQCAIVFSQLCGALACLGCYSCCEACCSEACCSGDDG